MISADFERSVLRHPTALLVGCAAVMTLCWAQSLSHLISSSREFFEQPYQWRSLSPLAAYAGSNSFALLDLSVERHIISALSAVGTRITPITEIWPLSDVLFRGQPVRHPACVPEPELFSGAALASFDYAGISSSLRSQPVR
jgi:hypothetical protein